MRTFCIRDILSSLQEYEDDDMHCFFDIAEKAFGSIGPVFMKKRYVDFFWHCATTVPGWIPQVVLANADAESAGSKKLFDLWKQSASGKDIDGKILYHAKDESRHSHIFVKLVNYAFPGMYLPEELNRITHRLTKIKEIDLSKKKKSINDYEMMDNLIQMNMGEIRTLVHMHFLGPVVFEMTPKENKEKVYNMLQGLANDEIVHISYTSRLINEWCKTGDVKRAKELYNVRLRDFHKFTIEQTTESINMYGQNKFPNLLEI